ncbi:DUF551 domain-containing protein [Escherichia coli]
MTTITKERLLTIKQWRETYGPGSNVVLPAEEAEELARIALASLEAEPVVYMWDSERKDIDAPGYYRTEHLVFAESSVKQWGGRVVPLYTAPPAHQPGGFTIEETQELYEDLVRSHISQALSGEKMKKSDRDADLRWIHGVIVQAAWFVKASLEQNTLTGNYPVTPDGWISCSERMPNTKTAVLVAVEFDRKGDWRMKWATYIPGHPDANDGWIIPGASWKPSHWMPLPEPPQEVN